MNKEELISEISKKTKVSKKEAGMILSATIDTIQSQVKKGEKITLVGFGTFSKKHRDARKGRNPQTGKELKIAAKNVPSFSAGKAFKSLLSK
jgi:DNA-binding protein HU-beta